MVEVSQRISEWTFIREDMREECGLNGEMVRDIWRVKMTSLELTSLVWDIIINMSLSYVFRNIAHKLVILRSVQKLNFSKKNMFLKSDRSLNLKAILL